MAINTGDNSEFFACQNTRNNQFRTKRGGQLQYMLRPLEERLRNLRTLAVPIALDDKLSFTLDRTLYPYVRASFPVPAMRRSSFITRFPGRAGSTVISGIPTEPIAGTIFPTGSRSTSRTRSCRRGSQERLRPKSSRWNMRRFH